MRKTTLYLPDDLKGSIQRLARAEGCSEAELVRRALTRMVESSERPRPRVPLSSKGLGDPTVALRVDELLDGFGR
jgi:hypothetical protein